MFVTINRTKLRPPTRKGPLVERPALLARLTARPRPRLAVIQAPAGFGKTSLLTQFHHAAGSADLAAVWLSIDASDNDCTRFLQHLIAALEMVGLQPGESLKEALASGARLPPTTACDLLSNAVADLERDVVVCMDDSHVLTDAAIGQLLTSLMQSPVAQMSWVIATRSTPSLLPLGRLRLLGELVEINARDLKFSNDESRQFFTQTAGLPLDPGLAVLLNERAEGWVAGLQMASLSLTGGNDPAEVAERFSGMNRNVSQFLNAEVLARLDEETCRFLLETSVLARMNTELCNYVTQRTDSRDRLDMLESANLFLFSLDDERNWYRYHHLFAAFLEQRLRQFQPDHARDLHERASVWLEENGCAIEAIEHALEARAFIRAARLLDRLNLYEQGQIGLQERLTARIPEAILEQFPNLQLERIWGWEAEWDFARSRTALQRLKQALRDWRGGRRPVPDGVNLDYIAAKLAHREMMVCLVSDDMASTRRMCERWLASRPPADSHMEVSTAGALMAAQREHYCCDGAAATTEALHQAYTKARFEFGEIFQRCISGLTFLTQADTALARRMYDAALRGAISLHGRLTPLASMPALLLAELHYEHNELAESRALIVDYLDVAHGLGYVDKLIAGYITKSRLEAVERQYVLAQRTLDDAERCAIACGFERLRAHVTAERLRQLLLLGRRDDAVEFARERGLLGSNASLQPHQTVTTLHEILAIAWARAAFARGELDGAIRLLKNWYRFTLEKRCFRSSIRLAVELAALLYARNELSAACHHVRDAVHYGYRGRFMRTIVDGGEQVREVLAAAVAGAAAMPDDEKEYAGELLQVFGSMEHCGAGRACETDAEGPNSAELNRRELDILELAASDVPNREIARRLALSENTVKWYWKRIFTKLSVHRRLQAVNSARASGVIF